MARIREVLRQGDRRRDPQTSLAAPAVGVRPGDRESRPVQPEMEEEIPFIEVGGKSLPMEASPSVLAAVNGSAARSMAAPAPRNETVPVMSTSVNAS